MTLFKKDPQAELDYSVDWSAWLGTDTIASSSWTVPLGLTAGANSHDTTSATVWLSGGTAGQTYVLTNEITTTGGRTDDRSFRIVCEQR